MLVSLGAVYLKTDVERDIGTTKQSPETKTLININTATIGELIQIKGIGPKTAERIVEYRDVNGPFFYIEDIQKVKGIGPKTFKAIRDWITLD